MIWIYIFTVLSVCSDSIIADGNCPDVENKDDVTFTFNSKCYEYVESIDTEVSFTTAEEDCRLKEGRLVTIQDNTTQVELVEQLEYISDSHTVIIGLRMKGSEWRWTTGDSLSYSNWDSDTSCNGTCACAVFNLSSGGTWERYNCDAPSWFAVHVCEYGSSSSSFSQSYQLLATLFFIVMKMTSER
ncbi:dromaiocalcin-1-like isoform X2 [Ruditapes philippinarum]|uniref:dromaiocalcin-1-like isoform X2 n=1 Tax=Ruditapes philippinarum TaxID=129788 RepID=UPI00295BC692|nr:dromaiocalcin-1-like isoform X2 [Ruditapes philippinarum]